jgi:hypothetical protein
MQASSRHWKRCGNKFYIKSSKEPALSTHWLNPV